MQLGRELGPDAVVLVNLSGRGDKDVHTAAAWFGLIGDEGQTVIADASADVAATADDGAKGMGEQL
jgi:tryptophan synthase beta chain